MEYTLYDTSNLVDGHPLQMEYTLYDTSNLIDGHPLQMEYICLWCQFVVFPLLTWLNATTAVFNTVLTAFFIKDFLYDIDTITILHHLVTTYLAWKYCNSNKVMTAFTIAEFGSGMRNMNRLAIHYNYMVMPSSLLYGSVMTASNIYCLFYVIYYYNEQYLMKTVVATVLITRQYYIF
jgi:hypothetical protein